MSERFNVVERAFANPGCCYLCGTSKGPFIDTKKNEQTHGVVYQCETCVTEMFRAFGLEDLAQKVIDPKVISQMAIVLEEVRGIRSSVDSQLGHIQLLVGSAGESLESAVEILNSALTDRNISAASAKHDDDGEADSDSFGKFDL